MDEGAVFNVVKEYGGAVGVVLLVGCVVLYRMYMNIYTDHKALYNDYRELAKENNNTIMKLTVLLETIKEKINNE